MEVNGDDDDDDDEFKDKDDDAFTVVPRPIDPNGDDEEVCWSVDVQYLVDTILGENGKGEVVKDEYDNALMEEVELCPDNDNGSDLLLLQEPQILLVDRLTDGQ